VGVTVPRRVGDGQLLEVTAKRSADHVDPVTATLKIRGRASPGARASRTASWSRASTAALSGVGWRALHLTSACASCRRFFFADSALRCFFLHFFFVVVVVAGVVVAGAAGAVQGTSVGFVKLFRGLGMASEKSAALLLVSSAGSRNVGQLGLIFRVRDRRALSAGAGVPALSCRS